jgi:RNA polymerase sigma factor (sigma-70 family)
MKETEISQKSPKSVPLLEPNLSSLSQYHEVWFKMACKIISKKDCEDEANELLQETYLKLHEHFKKNEVDSISSLFVYKSIRNLYYNLQTKKQYEFATDEMAVFESIDESTESLELRKMMVEALDEIPYLEREVLLQHQEKSQRQLQRETGVCRDRLRVHKNRGMNKLKKIVKEKLKTA